MDLGPFTPANPYVAFFAGLALATFISFFVNVATPGVWSAIRKADRSVVGFRIALIEDKLARIAAFRDSPTMAVAMMVYYAVGMISANGGLLTVYVLTADGLQTTVFGISEDTLLNYMIGLAIIGNSATVAICRRYIGWVFTADKLIERLRLRRDALAARLAPATAAPVG